MFNQAVLLDMLTYGRPAGSETEAAFINRFICPLLGVMRDTFGNYIVRIGDAPVLWSCHLDTVHWQSARQTVHYDAATGIVQLSKRSRRHAHCLGADDTAGVFLCWSLIRAGVPGLYVFHRSEERGGIGSDAIAHHTPALLDDTLYAVAFDRRGYGDVITHQGSRCCSDEFAHSLADQLNANVSGFAYRPDDTGIFTDTANYTDLIGECTNLSVGYFSEHSSRESLDVHHLECLYYALKGLNVSALVCKRLPGEVDEEDWTWINGWRDYSPNPALTLVSNVGNRPIVWDEDDETADLHERKAIYLDAQYDLVQRFMRKNQSLD